MIFTLKKAWMIDDNSSRSLELDQASSVCVCVCVCVYVCVCDTAYSIIVYCTVHC